MTQCRVALAQVESSTSVAANLERASGAVETASNQLARMIVFPEYFMWWQRGHSDPAAVGAIAQGLDGEFVRELGNLAARADVWIIAGMIEANSGGLPFNTTVVIDADGRLRATYRKSHLFDAFRSRESSSFAAGSELFTPVDTPAGTLGLFVCYELRFPEMARAMTTRGATVLAVPSAWVAGANKEMQWRTLLQARAIENGCYVLAAAQTGNEFTGHSMLVDPSGVVLADAGDGEEVSVGVVDTEEVKRVRANVPATVEPRADKYGSANR